MDKQVTEISSSIDEIHLTSNVMLQQLKKIIDDGEQERPCYQDSESVETEIRKLQSHMKSLEDKVNKRDENRQSNDIKMMMDKLDVLEREFKLLESDDTVTRKTNLSRNATGSKLLPRQTNTTSENEFASKTTHSSKRNVVTKSKNNMVPKTFADSSEKINKHTSKGNKSVSSMQRTEERMEKDMKSNIVVGKPNFTKPKHEVGLVKQEKNVVYDGERYWRSRAQKELDEYRIRYRNLEGVHSVICLDISESMVNANAWTEARTFITDYLTGLENVSKSHSTNIKTEYVALVTFGHQTQIQVGYTDNFINIEEALDKLMLGGPTQMYGGILMALAAYMCSNHRIQRLDNYSHIFSKIILVSDGRTTEDELIAGPDIPGPDPNKIDDTKAKILQEMEKFRDNHIDLFFVPVGESDDVFQRTMAECSGGFIFDYRQGHRLSKRQYLTSRLLDPLGLVAGLSTKGSDYDISQEDKEDLMSIQASARRHGEENVKVNVNRERNVYNETKSTTLPPIGSRVRRGPDWHYNIQDSHGPGTVIGQADNDMQVWVEWDADEHQNIYMYGPNGYDLLIVDEPRKLNPGEKIAVGCKVEPGNDWKHTDGNEHNGVVIKVNRGKKKAEVRWNNGKRDSYSYDELQEIKVKTEDDTRGVTYGACAATTIQGYELEPPKTMTIEEFAAQQEKEKNNNSD